MHDCLRTQDNLIDLLFDELDGATRARLTAEVAACADCGAQYRSLTKTLDACDAASAAAMPRESYWPQYHAALTRRLHGATRIPRAESAPFWRRLFNASIRVPAPLAATVVLLLLATSIIALSLAARSAPEPVVLAAPDSSHVEAAPQIKFIEVPIVQEKIITQTIYVPRRNRNGGDAPARESLADAKGRNAPATTASATPSRANLSGFKPAGEVNLRIIKGSDAREK